MESREIIVADVVQIAEELSMFGVLKLRWVARHLRKVELREQEAKQGRKAEHKAERKQKEEKACQQR